MGEKSKSPFPPTLKGLIEEHGLSPIAALCVVDGKTSLEEALHEKRRNARAQELVQKPNSEWPPVNVAWDTSPENWHRSLDGISKDDFEASFSDVALGWARSEALHSCLRGHSTRLTDPFSEPYRTGSARVVAHLELGGQITPPLLTMTTDGLQVIGGNHRLGWAKHMGQVAVPLLYPSPERRQIEHRLTLHETYAAAVRPAGAGDAPGRPES